MIININQYKNYWLINNTLKIRINLEITVYIFNMLELIGNIFGISSSQKFISRNAICFIIDCFYRRIYDWLGEKVNIFWLL